MPLLLRRAAGLQRRQIARLVLQNVLKQPGCFDDATGATTELVENAARNAKESLARRMSENAARVEPNRPPSVVSLCSSPRRGRRPRSVTKSMRG